MLWLLRHRRISLQTKLLPSPLPVFFFFSTEYVDQPSAETSAIFNLLLQQCSSSLQTKQVHAQLIYHRQHLSYFLSAHLIAKYSRFGLLFDAHSVFNELLEQSHCSSSLLWNSILRASLTHKQPKEAFHLYLLMRELGSSIPDGFTFPLVIRACSSLLHSRLCASVHSHVVSMGFQLHLHVANELIVMYSNLGQMGAARKVFEILPLRNVVSWNALISGYSQCCNYKAAYDIFQRMECEGPEPNPVTWTALLSAHARCQKHTDVITFFDKMRLQGRKATAEAVAVALSVCPYVCSVELHKGKAIHCFAIRSGLHVYSFVRNALICSYGKIGNIEDAKRMFWETEYRDIVSWNSLITGYASSGFCSEAYEVFIEMEKSGEVIPNVVSWSAMIGGYAMSGSVELSLDLFRQMQRAGVKPNSVTIATVLSACAELSALRLGKEIHAHVIRGLMHHNLLVANGLLNMYTKSGSLRDGLAFFDCLKHKDLISWNSMIAGYGIHGLCDEAVKTFYDMTRVGCEPDSVTFVALLSACSHSGRVLEGRKYFDQMVNEHGISPTMEHYSCMVDLYGRAGLLKEARELIDKVPTEPNPCVWGALLNSCRIYGNPDVAKDTMAEVAGFEGEVTGSYMLLSNIYAASGRWEESARVRVTAKLKGLKKAPGSSWIEMKNKVYRFSATGVLPTGAEDVYIVLESLYQQMDNEKLSPAQKMLEQNGRGKVGETVTEDISCAFF